MFSGNLKAREREVSGGMEFPVVVSQYFWRIRLNELLDHDSYQIEKYVEGVGNPKELADKVIRDVEYPFHHGQPDDLHVWNAFHGKRCYKVEEDFWQKASETAFAKMGDCEDSSILYVAAARRLGVKPEDVFVVFGYVQTEGGEFLGGHGWVYVRDPSFGKEGFVYVETTLDEPPAEYPKVPDIAKPFNWRGIVLVPEILWNDEIYRSVASAANFGLIIYQLRRYWGVKKRIFGYADLGRKLKETKKKYEALQLAWKLPVKPLKKAGVLSRLRWRR